MLVSYELSQAGGFSAAKAAERIGLGRGIHAAADPGKGLIRARKAAHIDLEFLEFSQQAEWLELAFRLGGGSWCGCSRFFLRARAAAARAIPVRAALRLHRAEGFEDVFAPAPMQFGPAPAFAGADWDRADWDGAEIAAPAWALQGCVSVDLHLFLPPQDGSFALHEFAVTAAEG